MTKKTDIVKAGHIYDVDSRKGLLTIKLLEDVDLKKDTFFEAEIVVGKAKFASNENRLEQKANGKGTPGHVETFRTTLCHFKKHRFDLDGAEPVAA